MSLAHDIHHSNSEKPVNVVATTDITDVATVEQQIEQHARRIEAIQREAVFEMGQELSAARDLFKYDRREGGFEGWVDDRLKMSRRSAYNLIQIFEGIREKSAELCTLSTSALLETASAEPDVQAIIAEQVEAGKVFTAAQVKEIKAAAAQEAIDRINAEAEQVRTELAALKKSAEEKDIKSAAEVRDRDLRIEELAAKVNGYEAEIERHKKSLPKPAKAKEQAAAAPEGTVIIGSDGKFHSGSSAEQKRMHDAFMFAFDKALDLTENPPSPERVVAGCPEGDRERLAELCVGAADYFIKIRAALNGK